MIVLTGKPTIDRRGATELGNVAIMLSGDFLILSLFPSIVTREPGGLQYQHHCFRGGMRGPKGPQGEHQARHSSPDRRGSIIQGGLDCVAIVQGVDLSPKLCHAMPMYIISHLLYTVMSLMVNYAYTLGDLWSIMLIYRGRQTCIAGYIFW